MTATVFVDTNILVYRRDATDPRKQKAATAWLDLLWHQKRGRVSFQVLQEFYVTVTRKLRPGLGREDARDDIRALLAWKPITIDTRVLENAWAIEDRFRLSWWDSLIVSAAQTAACRFLLSEDLQTGQDFNGVKVISPFSTDVAEIFPQRV